MACHSDDTLRIMHEGGGVSDEEKMILGGFRWNRNEVVVHSDEAVRTSLIFESASKLIDLSYLDPVDAEEQNCMVVLELFDEVHCGCQGAKKGEQRSGCLVSGHPP